jgi:hypothetical protein
VASSALEPASSAVSRSWVPSQKWWKFGVV